jgi:ribosomal protein S27E
MSVDYKYKPGKHKFRVNLQTIDELHKEHIDKFKKNRDSIPEKQRKLKSLEKELKDLERKTDGRPINLDSDILKKRNTLKNAIKELNFDIENITSCNGEMDYYSKTGEVVYDYYDITNGVLYGKNYDEPVNDNKQRSGLQSQRESGKRESGQKTYQQDEVQQDDVRHEIQQGRDSQSLLKNAKIEISDELLAITNLNKTRKLKRPVKKRNKRVDNIETKNIMSYLLGSDDEKEEEDKKSSLMCKATLQNEYLMMVDKEYACTKKASNFINRCKDCNVDMIVIHSDSILACPKCGSYLEIIIESEIPSQRETFTEKPKYPYKRIGHCIEKLNQFLCKGTVNIPPHVITVLEEEIKKNNIADEDVTVRFLEKMLKKHRMSDYYENIMYIYNKITKTTPQTITREEYEIVLGMFKEAEEIYEKKYKPKTRNNFLKYTFVLNKIFLLIGREDIADHFKLLKNPIKMKEQENIWKNMCTALGWDTLKFKLQIQQKLNTNVPKKNKQRIVNK